MRRKRAEAEPAALEAVGEAVKQRAAAMAKARRQLEEAQAQADARFLEAITAARRSGHPMREIAAAAGLTREYLYDLMKQARASGD